MGDPWEDIPEVWEDEKACCNWLRGQVRRIWSRHPIKISYIHKRRVHKDSHPLLGLEQNKRVKWYIKCEMCGEWYPQSQTEVDHIHGGKGFSDYEEFKVWMTRMLLVGYDDIRVLCKSCHKDVTLSQKLGCTMEEVPLHKERIAFGKMKAAEQKYKLTAIGLTPEASAKAREQQYWEWLTDY